MTQAKAWTGKHFKTPEDCLSYIFNELSATLTDDLLRMKDEVHLGHYEPDDITEMSNKISDIEALEPYVELLPTPKI